MDRHENQLTERVASLVRKNFAASSAAAVARALNVSDRTLRRHLAAEGSSFQEILSAQRFAMAAQLLTSSGSSVQDIAARLGYSDASNFGHAFRQWSGMSPRQYRQHGSQVYLHAG